MVKFVERRIADTRIVRLIQKWLAAGVLEEGKLSKTKVAYTEAAHAPDLNSDEGVWQHLI